MNPSNAPYRRLQGGRALPSASLCGQAEHRFEGLQLFGTGPIQQASQAHSEDPLLEESVIKGALAEATVSKICLRSPMSSFWSDWM